MTSESDVQRLWTAKDFLEYVNLRWGSPLFQKSCRWYGKGSIVSCDTGKVIALLEGLEWGHVRNISKRSNNQGTTEAIVSSKKLYFLKDPETGSYLSEHTSQRQTRKVHPIFHPQQVELHLVWNDRSVDLRKQHGSLSCTTREARVINMAPIQVYSLPTFVNARNRKGGYVATLEKYELYRQTHFWSRLFMSPILSWVRFGDCPSWYGKGKCVSYLVSKKLSNFHSLPKEFARQVKNYDPFFLQQAKPSHEGKLLDDDQNNTRNKRIIGERSFNK